MDGAGPQTNRLTRPSLDDAQLHAYPKTSLDGSAQLAEAPRRPARTVASPVRRLWGDAVEPAWAEHAGRLGKRGRGADEGELPHRLRWGQERRHRRRTEATAARLLLGLAVGGGLVLVGAGRRDHATLIDGHVDAALPPRVEAWSFSCAPHGRYSVVARTGSHGARVDAARGRDHLLLEHPAHSLLLQQHEGVALLVALSCSHLFGHHAVMDLARRLVPEGTVEALRGSS